MAQSVSTQITTLLPPWPQQTVDAFMRDPVVFEHRLADSGLFEDDGLAALLDRYPEDAIDINLYDYDDEGQVSLRTGARAGASGAELLEAVRQGRLWLNCKFALDMSAEIGAMVHDIFAEIGRRKPAFAPRKVWGQLLISSPATKVPYHADPSGVILFHIRGRKRIYVYPADEAHVPAAELEKIVAKQQTEELPYKRAMDANARVYDLEPGQAIGWPLFAPHRVENLSSFCVSLSVDYLTRAQQYEAGMHYTNLALRRMGLRPPQAQAMPMPAKAAFWLASGALKRMGVFQEKLSTIPRAFTPRAGAADGAGQLEAVGRVRESA